MYATLFERRLVSSRTKLALFVFVLSLASLGCVVADSDPTANSSLTVHVSNAYGPVAGLRLQAMRPKDTELSDLIPESIRARITFEKVTRVMESTTDANGDAHFDLDRAGHWYVKADNAAGWWTGVYAGKQYQNSIIDLQWPHGGILETKMLRGHIRNDRVFGHGLPVHHGTLSVRSLVSFEQISSSMTKDDGTFQIDGVPPGIYFLGLNTNDSDRYDPLHPQGYIAVGIRDDGPRDSLSIVVQETDCGFAYGLEGSDPLW